MVVLIVILCLVAAGLVLGAIFSSFFTVRQQTTAIIERFGKYSRTVGAGFHVKIPLGIEKIAARPSLRVQQLDLEMESKTKDDVTVKLRLAIQYCIPSQEKVYDAHYKLVDVRQQMDSWVFDVVRSKVPAMSLNQVYENKDEIAVDVEERLKERMHLYGFEIVRVLVNDIVPPDKVLAAMNEVNTQQRLQAAAAAEGEKNKILIVKKAEAEAESKKLQGIGIANERKAIMTGLKEAVEDFKGGISDATSQDAMTMLLMTQYFDTLAKLGTDSRSKVVFAPSNPGAVGDLMSQLRTAISTAEETTHPSGDTTGVDGTVEPPSKHR